jgi:aspartokinase
MPSKSETNAGCNSSTNGARKKHYKERRLETGLSRPEWGRLYLLGKTTHASQLVYKKETSEQESARSATGVSKGESLAAELLAILHKQGFDLKSIVFDDAGKITSIKKR